MRSFHVTLALPHWTMLFTFHADHIHSTLDNTQCANVLALAGIEKELGGVPDKLCVFPTNESYITWSNQSLACLALPRQLFHVHI